MKVLSYVRSMGGLVFLDETVATIFLKEAIRGGGLVTCSSTDTGRLVRHPVTGKPVPYSAVVGVVIAPPVVVPINWQSMPAVPAGSTDYMIPPGNYINEDPSKLLLQLPYRGRLVVGMGTAAQPMRLRFAGDCFGGYEGRLVLDGVWMEALNPGVKGQRAGKIIQGDYIHRFEMYRSRADGTSGILLTGKVENGQNYWLGDPNAGDRIRIEQSFLNNVRGQYSDGTKDPNDPLRIIPIRSNWGTNHKDNPNRWNPSVPAAERTDTNKADPAKYGELGWESTAGVMLRFLSGLVDSRIVHNRILNEYGKSRTEDNINLYMGAGGKAGAPLIVGGGLTNGGQGLDWNYVEGAGVAYDGSNQITLNATSYQDISQTGYSGTGLIVDDELVSTTTGSWESSGYTTFRDYIVIGNIPSIQSGHDQTFTGIASYEALLTQAGDPLKNSRYGFQITDYHKQYNKPRTAVTAAGVTKEIWASNGMDHCSTYGGTTSGGSLLDSNSMTDLLYNGGSYDTATNLKYPRLAAGFEAQLTSSWLAAKAQAGVPNGLPY